MGSVSELGEHEMSAISSGVQNAANVRYILRLQDY
jgi:hypothetical protein